MQAPAAAQRPSAAHVAVASCSGRQLPAHSGACTSLGRHHTCRPRWPSRKSSFLQPQHAQPSLCVAASQRRTRRSAGEEGSNSSSGVQDTWEQDSDAYAANGEQATMAQQGEEGQWGHNEEEEEGEWEYEEDENEDEEEGEEGDADEEVWPFLVSKEVLEARREAEEAYTDEDLLRDIREDIENGEDDEDDKDQPQSIADLNREYIDFCQGFAIPGVIDIEEGVNGLPCIQLRHPNGCQAEIYMHGANVTSWRKPDGTEILYLRQDNTFDGKQPIQGGIPICWPQYGKGELPTHGFLRNCHWSLIESGVSPDWAEDPAPSIALVCEADAYTYEIFPFSFQAMYTVSLMEIDDYDDDAPGENPVDEEPVSEEQARQFALKPDPDFPEEEEAEDVRLPYQLRCVLEVMNTDERPFTFTTALQTHYSVQNLATHQEFVRILGLGGKYTLDYTADPLHPRLQMQDKDYVYFGEQIERIFVDADEGDVLLCPGDRTHYELQNREGFTDVGAWNPNKTLPAAYQHFVAMPSARIARPVTLQPGETWKGEMVIRAHNEYWEPPPFDQKNVQPLPPRHVTSTTAGY